MFVQVVINKYLNFTLCASGTTLKDMFKDVDSPDNQRELRTCMVCADFLYVHDTF
jgi:hypothetical protein